MKNFFSTSISLYQLILSPLLLQISGVRCRYQVTCSAYAKKMIEEYGIVKGSQKTIARILTCQDFSFFKFHLSTYYDKS